MSEAYKIWAVWWVDAGSDPEFFIFMQEHRARECYERSLPHHERCGIHMYTIYPEVKAHE